MSPSDVTSAKVVCCMQMSRIGLFITVFYKHSFIVLMKCSSLTTGKLAIGDIK